MAICLGTDPAAADPHSRMSARVAQPLTAEQEAVLRQRVEAQKAAQNAEVCNMCALT